MTVASRCPSSHQGEAAKKLALVSSVQCVVQGAIFSSDSCSVSRVNNHAAGHRHHGLVTGVRLATKPVLPCD